MKRHIFLASFTALGLSAALPSIVAAQADEAPAPDNVNLVIVYGDDKCEVSPDATVIDVCVRMAEDERFRIPPNLRSSEDPENESWANRVESLETVGASGINSCSPSGYGGWTGCTQQLIKQAYAEKRASPNVRAAQLIAEERAKRLETIDADAAAEQARVEQLEREYEARLAKERESAVPGETPSDE